MKVKVRRWPCTSKDSVAMDAWFLWFLGKMPGECYERIAIKQGKEYWLYRPSRHGEKCPSNGEHPGIECRCDNCDYYLACFPEYAR